MGHAEALSYFGMRFASMSKVLANLMVREILPSKYGGLSGLRLKGPAIRFTCEFQTEPGFLLPVSCVLCLEEAGVTGLGQCAVLQQVYEPQAASMPG